MARRFGQVRLYAADAHYVNGVVEIEQDGRFLSPAIKYNGEKVEVLFSMRLRNFMHGEAFWETAGLQVFTFDAEGRPINARETEDDVLPRDDEWFRCLVGHEQWPYLRGWVRYGRRFVFPDEVKYIRVGCFMNRCRRENAYFDDVVVRYAGRSEAPAPVHLTVDAGSRTRRWDNFYDGLDDGAWGIDYDAPVYKDLRREVADMGFRYVRLGEPFARVSVSMDGDALVCDWSRLDEIIEGFLQLGIRPMLLVNNVPEVIASGSEDSRWWMSPPRDYDLWRTFIRQWAEHLVSTFGREEVRRWYFELWNEPDLKEFFAGDPDDYLKLYDQGVEGLLDVDTEFRIGGPTVSCATGGFLPGFIDHCTRGENHATGRTGSRMDFVSFHAYTCGNPFPRPGDIVFAARKVKEMLTQRNAADTPLAITEWNSWYPFADTDYNAGFICRCVKGLADEGCVAEMFYYCLVETTGDDNRMYKKDLGLFTVAGVPTPACAAFSALNRLHGGRVGVEGGDDMTDALVTEDNGKITALVWTASDDPDEPRFPARSVRLEFDGLGEGPHTVTCYAIDSRRSSAVDDWTAAGSLRDPSPGLVEKLRKAGELERVGERTMEPENGRVSLRFSMPLFAVYVVELEHRRAFGTHSSSRRAPAWPKTDAQGKTVREPKNVDWLAASVQVPAEVMQGAQDLGKRQEQAEPPAAPYVATAPLVRRTVGRKRR